MIRSFGILVAFACACASFSQTYVGTYKGRMTIDRTAVASSLTAEQKKMVENAFKELDKMKLTLTINKDKTFKLTTIGGPGTSKTNSSSGTWVPAGKSLKLTFKTVNDKPMSKAQEQTLTVADNGKTLTLIPASGQGAGKSKVIFTKA